MGKRRCYIDMDEVERGLARYESNKKAIDWLSEWIKEKVNQGYWSRSELVAAAPYHYREFMDDAFDDLFTSGVIEERFGWLRLVRNED